MKRRFKPGDRITHPHFPSVVREIVDVRANGYGWRYPEFGERTAAGYENYFISENSTDPELDGWVLASPSSKGDDEEVPLTLTRRELSQALEDIWRDRGPGAEDLSYVKKMTAARDTELPE